MKIPKLQTAWLPIVVSDNTRVTKPVVDYAVERKLQPGEFFYTTKSGNTVVGRSQNATILLDNRTEHQKQLANKAKVKAEEAEKLKKLDEGAELLLESTKLMFPSTYVGPLFRDNGKSYSDNLLSGEGSGSTVGNLAIDALLPIGIARSFNNIKSLTKQPLKLRSYLLTDIYNPSTKRWNITKLQQMVLKGLDDAIGYFSNDAFLKTLTHNEELAKRLGFKNFTLYPESVYRAYETPRMKYIVDSKSKDAGMVDLADNATDDLVTLNLFYDPESTSFHEHIHRGLGPFAPINQYLDKYHIGFNDTEGFYNYLTSKVLKPKDLLAKEGLSGESVNYLSNHYELADNLLETGRLMGIKPGDPFPGKAKMMELIEKFQKQGTNKSGIFNYLNLNKPVRVWRGLNGTLFSGAAASVLDNTIGNDK